MPVLKPQAKPFPVKSSLFSSFLYITEHTQGPPSPPPSPSRAPSSASPAGQGSLEEPTLDPNETRAEQKRTEFPPAQPAPASCHKHVLHSHKNTQEASQRTQEHLTFSFKLRKASFEQELLTPCASPLSNSWEREASPAHRKCSLNPPRGSRPSPAAAPGVSQPQPGAGTCKSILSRSWPEP